MLVLLASVGLSSTKIVDKGRCTHIMYKLHTARQVCQQEDSLKRKALGKEQAQLVASSLLLTTQRCLNASPGQVVHFIVEVTMIKCLDICQQQGRRREKNSRHKSHQPSECVWHKHVSL